MKMNMTKLAVAAGLCVGFSAMTQTSVTLYGSVAPRIWATSAGAVQPGVQASTSGDLV